MLIEVIQNEFINETISLVNEKKNYWTTDENLDLEKFIVLSKLLKA